MTRVQKAAQSLLCVRGTDFNGEDELKIMLKASGNQILEELGSVFKTAYIFIVLAAAEV